MPEVREQILCEATRLFAARGFEGTSLRGVAEAVGIRKPSLLYHFKSKDELRRSVLENVLSHWNDVLPKLLMAAASGEDRFDAVITETVAFFAEDGDRARLLSRELLDRPHQIRELTKKHVRPWVEVISKYIRKGQDEGLIYDDVDPEAYIVHVMNLVVGICTAQGSLEALSTGEDDVDDRHIKELLRMAKCALFRPQSERPMSAPEKE